MTHISRGHTEMAALRSAPLCAESPVYGVTNSAARADERRTEALLPDYTLRNHGGTN